MGENVWEAYGLKGNPFEVKPVEKDGVVPLESFVGREKEKTELKRIIENGSRSATIVVGDAGVGKTSLVNYVRTKTLFDKYFSTRREIDCQEEWGPSDFLLNTLYEIYDSVKRLEKPGECAKLLDSLKPIFENLERSGGVEAFGFGVCGSDNRSLPRTPFMLLKNKLEEVVSKACQIGFKGVILHYNNLENFVVEDDKKFKGFLLNARGILELNNCHFVFVGNKTVEDGFNFHQKVKDYISGTVTIGALNKKEVKQIVCGRFEALKIPNLVLTAPVSDECIEYLYELHEGNIRDILSALQLAVTKTDRKVKRDVQLTPWLAKKVLKEESEERIKMLAPKTREVLAFIIKKKKVTPTQISKQLAIIPQNTSNYLAELRKNGFIVLLEINGRNRFYAASTKAKWFEINLGDEHPVPPITNW